jgi:ribonuclease R
MQDHVGYEYDGTISGVTHFGLFVTLDELYVDGLVHISDLGQDYYQFDAAKHLLRGERSGVRYQLGQRVRVKVVRVNLEQSKIDFVIAEQKDTLGGGQAKAMAQPRDQDKKMKKIETRFSDGGRKGKKR